MQHRACTMDHLLASVSAFMQSAPKLQLPTKKDTVMDHATRVAHPGEVCDLKGGCAPLFGVGYAMTCNGVRSPCSDLDCLQSVLNCMQAS